MRIYSPLAQWWSDRLLTGRLKVRVLQGEPFKTPRLRGFLRPEQANCFACVRTRKPEPYASLNEVKGEHGEAGPRAPHVSKATCGRVLQGEPFKTPRLRGFCLI